jgi:hypothetical protein
MVGIRLTHFVCQSWARREAIARMKIKEEGGEVEFGKYYSMIKEDREPTDWDDVK